MSNNQATQLSRAIDEAERNAEQALNLKTANVFNQLRADLIEILDCDALVLYPDEIEPAHVCTFCGQDPCTARVTS